MLFPTILGPTKSMLSSQPKVLSAAALVIILMVIDTGNSRFLSFQRCTFVFQQLFKAKTIAKFFHIVLGRIPIYTS